MFIAISDHASEAAEGEKAEVEEGEKAEGEVCKICLFFPPITL